MDSIPHAVRGVCFSLALSSILFFQSALFLEASDSTNASRETSTTTSKNTPTPNPSAQNQMIQIESPWMRLVPPVSDDSAAFMVIKNTSDHAIVLTGASSSIAKMVMPMITTKEKHEGKIAMGMKPVKSFSIPAQGQLTLEPGGNHLMMMGLTKPLKENETTEITLYFEPGLITIPISLQILRK